MHVTGEIPADARGQNLVLLIDFNGEGCVVDKKGNPILGLTTINSEFDKRLGLPGKRVVPFSQLSTPGKLVDFWIDAAANDLFGKLQENGTLRFAQSAICNEAVRALYYDFFVLRELMAQLPEDSARRARILAALYDVAQALSTSSEVEVGRAREILAPVLRKVGGTPSLTISAIGHAHIDLAWLWPLRETIRKGARTFAPVLALMERYPDYVFGASQPQLYQRMKDHYPKLYSRVTHKIAEGRWEVQGGMWVEPDVNISGGEALVRQILYGKRFFREEFGKEVNMLWLPDVYIQILCSRRMFC
jgi:alpha-mannosidase